VRISTPTRRNSAAVTTNDPFTRDDSAFTDGTVPLKEKWIVIPDVQLIPEGNPLTSAMIGSLVRHFVDARNDDTTSTNARKSSCIVDGMCCV
jgi:hypothetical protein